MLKSGTDKRRFGRAIFPVLYTLVDVGGPSTCTSNKRHLVPRISRKRRFGFLAQQLAIYFIRDRPRRYPNRHTNPSTRLGASNWLGDSTVFRAVSASEFSGLRLHKRPRPVLERRVHVFVPPLSISRAELLHPWIRDYRPGIVAVDESIASAWGGQRISDRRERIAASEFRRARQNYNAAISISDVGKTITVQTPDSYPTSDNAAACWRDRLRKPRFARPYLAFVVVPRDRRSDGPGLEPAHLIGQRPAGEPGLPTWRVDLRRDE